MVRLEKGWGGWEYIITPSKKGITKKKKEKELTKLWQIMGRQKDKKQKKKTTQEQDM